MLVRSPSRLESSVVDSASKVDEHNTNNSEWEEGRAKYIDECRPIVLVSFRKPSNSEAGAASVETSEMPRDCCVPGGSEVRRDTALAVGPDGQVPVAQQRKTRRMGY
jgi:hypothetical protein